MSQKERAKFGSKLGMILATAGGAVGLDRTEGLPLSLFILVVYCYWGFLA